MVQGAWRPLLGAVVGTAILYLRTHHREALGLVPGAPAFAVVKAVSVSGPAAEPR